MDNDDWYYELRVLRRADINGDGLEDLDVCWIDRAKGGTYSSQQSLLVTRYSPSAYAVALKYEVFGCEDPWPHGLFLGSAAWFGLVGLAVLVAAPACAQTQQSFDGLTCQSAIPKALIGRTMPVERVVVLVAPAGAAHSQSVLVSCPGDGAQAIQLAIVFSPSDAGRAVRTVPGVWLVDDQAVRFLQRPTAGTSCRELGPLAGNWVLDGANNDPGGW